MKEKGEGRREKEGVEEGIDQIRKWTMVNCELTIVNGKMEGWKRELLL